YNEPGETRPDLPGHEHFGFKDGISQPGVRGRIASDPDRFFQPRLIDPSVETIPTLAQPGLPLVCPAHFLLGYPPQLRIDAPPLRDWLRNGSFLVFRRLKQDVHAFRSFVRETADSLARQPGFKGMTAERLAALLIGRWPSGAPLMRVPDADDPQLGADEQAN